MQQNEIFLFPFLFHYQKKRGFYLKKSIKKNFKNLSQEEKKDLETQLTTQARKEGFSNAEIASISSLATIGAAQLSGIGVYLLASSTVGAITGLVGVTLPFAFYTTMSSVVSFAIGPAGALLAAIPLYKSLKDVRSLADLQEKGRAYLTGAKVLMSGNYETAEVILSYFASMRILKEEAYSQKIGEVSKKIQLKKEIVLKQKDYLQQEREKEKVFLLGKIQLENELKKVKQVGDKQINVTENKLQLEKEIITINEKIEQQQRLIKNKNQDIVNENNNIAELQREKEKHSKAKHTLLK